MYAGYRYIAGPPALSGAMLPAPDLELFLQDVNRNIAEDNTTDFKKLSLYLFAFAHERLQVLAAAPDAESNAFIPKLFSTIETVLAQKKHVLNSPVDRAEVSGVFGEKPPDFGLHAATQAPFFYQWLLHFALHWLAQFPTDLLLTNTIKGFLLELINIVAIQMLGYKPKTVVLQMLLDKVTRDADRLVAYVTVPELAADADIDPGFASLLACACHLFTVVNDYDISGKLRLRTAQARVQLDTVAKRLFFVLSTADLLQNDTLAVIVDTCKSVMLLNLASNVYLDPNVRWTSVQFILKLIHSQFLALLPQRGPSVLKHFTKSACRCVLRLFLFCREKHLVENFRNSFSTSDFQEASLPAEVASVVLILNQEGTDLAPKRFMDVELNELLSQIMHNSQGIVTELYFCIDSPRSFLSYLSTHSVHADMKTWLDYVRSMTSTDFLAHKATFHTFLSALRKVPCIISNNYNFATHQCTVCSAVSSKNIYKTISSHRRSVTSSSESNSLYTAIYCNLIFGKHRDQLQSNPLLATNFLLALYNLLAMFRLPEKDCGTSNTCFQYVITCLKSHSNRDVRILAARVLPLFLIRRDDKTLEDLVKFMFQVLSSINYSTKDIHLAESTLLALAELAIVCEGEWLCVVFIKMIDCLGESNEQHVNLAYNSLLYVALAKALTPYKMLSPYLPSIAERIVKNSRIFTRLTELLGITKKFFLSNTKEYTTPRLLEYYKRDFILEIAEACNMPKLKLITKTLSRTMALYLCKDEYIDAKYIVNVLSNASPHYKKVTVADLVPNVGEVLWFILLQMQMDDEGQLQNEAKIFRAIVYVGKISWMKRPENDHLEPPSESDFDYVYDILQEHVLELAQRFSENVHQIKGIKPYFEKVSSIKAIQFLISKNTTAASWALGQISTCLQAAMDSPSLETHALRCWNVLVQRLELARLVSLFDITISLMFQKFHTFSHRSKLIAAEILRKMFAVIKDEYIKYGPYYYSYPYIKDLDLYYVPDASASLLLKLKSNILFFPELTRRLQTGNRIVIHQALDDLINSANAHQKSWQTDTLRDDNCIREISDLIRSVLDISVQFRNKDAAISTKSAKVLASLGSLDANRFNFKGVKAHTILLHDFQDYRENARFLVDFIQTKVIKNFWASNDPIRQLFSVYSMQSFLSILGLDPSVLEPGTQGVLREVWNEFSEIDKSTLTPLLSSRYFAQTPRFEPLAYPHFVLGMRHDKWLVDITTNLFRRPISTSSSLPSQKSQKSKTAKTAIFQTCSMLIRDEEVSISQYLLKYVALSHIVNGDEDARTDILSEFLAILKTNLHRHGGTERVENLKLCYQSVFEVLDYFNEWVSAATQKLSDVALSKADAAVLNKRRLYVTSILKEIPTELIAQTSSQCDSFERTILYVEKCYRNDNLKREGSAPGPNGEGSGKVQGAGLCLDIASTLQTVYSSIDDYDALNGVLKKFSTRNLKEKLHTFQFNENWYIAQESFHVLSHGGNESDRVEYTTKLLKSFADHALYDKVLASLDSTMWREKYTQLPMAWAVAGVLASVQSGHLDEIAKWNNILGILGKPNDVEAQIMSHFADSILQVHRYGAHKFELLTDNIYSIVGQSLALSMSSSFSRNARLMRQLHMVFDAGLICTTQTSKAEMLGILHNRLKNTDLEFDSQWRLLAVHRLCYDLTGQHDYISSIHLACLKVARQAKRLDIATKCIMNAMAASDENANVEYAHLLWEQGKQTEAIKTLSESLASEATPAKSRARQQLQYALWLDESSHSSQATIVEEYVKAFRLDKEWEKPFFDLGKYYCKIMDTQSDSSGLYERQIIRHYLQALILGTKYIFEALPKLISVWLDFAQKPQKTKDGARRLESMVAEIFKRKDDVPAYVWYTSITQILSRITHTHEPSVNAMLSILGTLVTTYPKHSLWYVLSHIKSKDSKRKQRVLQILDNVRPVLGTAVVNAKELFEILESLASHKVKRASKKRWTLTDDFHVRDTNKPYDSLVVPVKANLEIKIPKLHSRRLGETFHAFAKSPVTFDGFDEDVVIFLSLQMPKQITIRGTDNNAYRLMVKRDDTRKDAKVFELTNMINWLLLASVDARKRSLTIENYSVIPLAEDMGVIEFVANVQTMKAVIQLQQKKLGLSFSERKIFQKLDEAQKVHKANPCTKTKEDLEVLFQTISNGAAPVLHNWFIEQFPDPAIWYVARKTYIRTSAVMSIVGYVIGLGDRHCENILFLKESGASLHIDFDCLFEKGKTLPTPEIVPFRLTQNMVDAMGITGIEGPFRIACEVTGTLMRANEASLMNILETLIYDPLLDWRTLEKPHEHLKRVRHKIRGLLDEKEGMPMNVHGQVDVLIQQATSASNLSQMYAGWAPYI